MCVTGGLSQSRSHFRKCALLWIIDYTHAYYQCLNEACCACYCQLGGWPHKLVSTIWVRNNTNTAGVYQSSTQVRNNTNSYSPLKASLEGVGFNPRLEWKRWIILKRVSSDLLLDAYSLCEYYMRVQSV